MILLDMSVTADEEDEPPVLLLEFSSGNIAFQCPIGMPAAQALDALKQFIVLAEDILKDGQTIH